MRVIRWEAKRLERLARNRAPGYLDALRACKLPESTDTHWAFDAESKSYASVSAYRDTSKPAPAKVRNGPGDVVKLVLERMGFRYDGNGLVCANGARIKNCSCESMRHQMNQWGVWGCWKRRKEIVQWFTDRGKLCGVEIEGASIMALLLAAWKQKKT